MLNEKARSIYAYIRRRIDEGYAPTVREICDALEIRSTSTVHRYINMLVEEGLLDKMDRQNRAIRLHGLSALSVPVIERPAPDIPLTAPENAAGYISFVPETEPAGNLFAVRVQNDDLRGCGILPGDLVVAVETDRPAGRFAVVQTESGSTALTEHPAAGAILGSAIAILRHL